MEEIIRVQDQYYILAASPRVDERTRALKHGDTFAVLGPQGDITPVGQGGQGLYHEGTRHLSRLELRLLDRRPFLLSSTVRQDVPVLGVDLANADAPGELPRDMLHLHRTAFLWNGTQYERFRVRNYAPAPVPVSLTLHVDADFADIFEVRGTRREKRGRVLPPQILPGALLLSYEGLDGVVRRTRIAAEAEIGPSRLTFSAILPPGAELTWHATIACGPEPEPFDTALSKAGSEFSRLRDAEILTSSEPFNEWIRRSRSDLCMMTTETPEGPYPYAGIPWFSTVFGRDGIWTALEILWMHPEIARGVLLHLASLQARESSPERDAEPGKILHEVRRGEMAALGEIPFGLYYGSVDSTPLFVLLAGEYYRRTADRALIERLWPNLEAALRWIDEFGDRDGDGFVEYARRSSKGLASQGWKDSGDAIFHSDGALAEGPVALCEVQGYVYAARLRAAELAELLGRTSLADQQRAKAEQLRIRFEEAFWLEDRSTYAIALDGRKRPCRVRSSNAGHLLFAGIVRPDRARRVAETLLDETSFSGWGVRTIPTTEARYNPMAYHNGSVWPHDNAILAQGLSRYGIRPLRILSGLFDASLHVESGRLPELFCGFERRVGEGPTLYPVACSPQAWASGAVFLLLQACLGLEIDAVRRVIRLHRAVLPDAVDRLTIHRLRVGSACVDLALHRYPQDVGVSIVRREGDVEVVSVK